MMWAGRSCPVALSGTVRLMRYGVAPYDAAKKTQQKCHVRNERDGVVCTAVNTYRRNGSPNGTLPGG